MKKSLSVFLALVLIFCAVTLVVSSADAPLETLMFASDYQQDGSVHPLTYLTDIADVIYNDGKNVDSFVMCGDMTNESGHSNYNGDETQTKLAWSRSRKALINVFGDDTEYHLLQGNHDPFIDSIMDENGPHEYEEYTLYVLNTESANPWGQGVSVGAEDIVKASAASLDKYLQGRLEVSDSRPIIIATHVPLHFSGRTGMQLAFVDGQLLTYGGTGDNMYSRYLFDVINKWGEYLNIVFLFGHNHSKGYDNYIGCSSIYLPEGSNILIPDSTGVIGCTNSYTVEKLNFTYMNAGYIGHTRGGVTEENSMLTCSVIEIFSDRLVISRYDTNGKHCLSGRGYYSDNPEYPDKLVFPKADESLLSPRIDSPAVISLKPAHVHSYVNGLCSACGVADPDYNIIPGDIDRDKKLTGKDMNLMKQIFLGTVEKCAAADLDYDGKVSISDVLLLKHMLIG